MPQPWEMNWSGSPAPQQGGATIVPLPEKPRQPPMQTATQASLDQINLKLKQQELAAAQAKKTAEYATFRGPVDEMLNVIDAAARAHRMTRNGGVTVTGPWGRALGGAIPGTDARALNGYLDTIGGNTAFKTLQQMRQESPTGGAVGNVSDKDLQLLRSVIASLDPGQPTPKFQQDLSKVLKTYQKVLYQLPGGREAFHNWRVNEFLGYDPAKKGQQKQAPKGQPQQGAVVDFNDLPE